MIELYFATHRVLSGLLRVLAMVFSGFWLGILTRKQLHIIGERKYGADRKYWTDAWNRSGLLDWERKVVERDFVGRKRLLVAAAGGGREVFALRRLGIEAAGFDPDPGLVACANEFLKSEGMVPDIRTARWDQSPELDGEYDGLIVGWSGYMLIRGREKRIEFLRELRARATAGSPLLLSFHTRDENARFFRGVAWIGNMLAGPMGRDRVELGDHLIPNFAHSFTRKELASELEEAGFQPILFETAGYGHAVARAV